MEHYCIIRYVQLNIFEIYTHIHCFVFICLCIYMHINDFIYRVIVLYIFKSSVCFYVVYCALYMHMRAIELLTDLAKYIYCTTNNVRSSTSTIAASSSSTLEIIY